MRVCFVSHTSGRLGAERALLEMLEALARRGVDCYVIVPRQGPLVEKLKDREIPFAIIPYRWWMGRGSPLWKRIGRIALSLAMAIPIAARIRGWRCDIVYTNTITVCVGALAARILGLAHVWHVHEFGYEDHRLSFDLGRGFSLWLMNQLSSAWIANSFAVASTYQEHLSGPTMKVVYFSVATPRSDASEKRAPRSTTDGGMRCAIVGSLHKEKRQEDAIKAIDLLVQSGIGAQLVIVGDGDHEYQVYLESLVAERGLSENVSFMGFVEDPMPFMRRSAVVLMCSIHEAFGRVTVEAMRAGRPVVGARSGGTVELIREGFNGLLYTPGDYEELADKIRYLSEHPEVAERLGRNGQEWAEGRFSHERLGEELLAVLAPLAGEAVHGSR